MTTPALQFSSPDADQIETLGTVRYAIQQAEVAASVAAMRRAIAAHYPTAVTAHFGIVATEETSWVALEDVRDASGEVIEETETSGDGQFDLPDSLDADAHLTRDSGDDFMPHWTLDITTGDDTRRSPFDLIAHALTEANARELLASLYARFAA